MNSTSERSLQMYNKYVSSVVCMRGSFERVPGVAVGHYVNFRKRARYRLKGLDELFRSPPGSRMNNSRAGALALADLNGIDSRSVIL